MTNIRFHTKYVVRLTETLKGLETRYLWVCRPKHNATQLTPASALLDSMKLKIVATPTLIHAPIRYVTQSNNPET